jgi:pSer/pThr/pTyr-binding forkhead associated (FHA) protein
MICSDCGASIIPGLPFCPKCGKRIKTPRDSVSACPNCGTSLPQGAQFCAACGKGVGPGAPKNGRTSAFAAQRVDAAGELVVLDESGEVTERHALVGDDTSIGREGADVEFKDDPFMSPLHAQVSVKDGAFVIRDLGSRNGTWIFINEPHRLSDGDLILIGSQVVLFRRLGYPGPHPPERDQTRRMGSLVPSADIARLVQLRSDGSQRDTLHLSPGRNLGIGRDRGDWTFPYDPSMSGLHAEVRSEDADFVVLDAGSRNGVAVSVRGEVSMTSGARFLVGDKMIRLEAP